MRKFCLGILLCCSTFAFSQSQFKWKETLFKFGEFQEVNIVSHDFKFKNISNEMIVIVKASASCGCTVAEYSPEPIKPGKWGFIKVTYNGKGKPTGFFRKAINIQTTHELTRVEIEGNMMSSK